MKMICPTCEKEFETIYTNKRYCSKKCCDKEYGKKYYEDNKNNINRKRRQYRKKRYIVDSLYRLKTNISRGVLKSIKRKNLYKNNKTTQYIGCTIGFLKWWLEKDFKPGMTWENHGEWHIDHIIPLATVNTEEDLIRVWHYSNLQPLWAEENIKKSSKVLY